MGTKSHLPIQIAILLSVVVLFLLRVVPDRHALMIMVIAFGLLGPFIGFFVVAQFCKSLRQSVWLPIVSSAALIYLGLLMLFLSMYPQLTKQIPWDASVAALGLAVMVFGMSIFMQVRRGHQSKLDGQVNRLSVRMQVVNDKLSNMEKTAKVWLEQAQRLGGRLVSPASEQSDKDSAKRELEAERASIASRLTGYLIWQSVLMLAFAEIMAKSVQLPQVLSILGLVSSCVGFVNFLGLPFRINALEDAVFGRRDKGIKRVVRTAFQGRSQGIFCSLVFTVFWIFAIVWSFAG